MGKRDGKFCEWCDEPATRMYPLRGSEILRVYACKAHDLIAEKWAYKSQSAALGSLADELEREATK